MGNSGSAHDFAPNLRALCREGETPADLKPVREIERSKVALKGAFGSARAGRVGQLKDTGVQVVVGVLGKKSATEDIFREIAQLVQVEDAHVMRIVSVVTAGFPLLINLEYCAASDLEAYVAANAGALGADPRAKIRILADVSDGLATLESQGIIHAHLSMRAVFVFEAGNVFKVGNVFGEFAADDKRYSAPEQLRGALATSASDVWAFAILAHQIMTLTPTANLTPGVAPTTPADGDAGLYEVLDRCWSLEPPSRPDFFWLRADFEERSTNP